MLVCLKLINRAARLRLFGFFSPLLGWGGLGIIIECRPGLLTAVSHTDADADTDADRAAATLCKATRAAGVPKVVRCGGAVFNQGFLNGSV